ncbi:MAG: FkbM family methyltransferase [Leptolyngbyaceae cyanobacterium SL_7_1]|nr:FkbM family methyltransferase [Leptolyngbyaceae cyanobacterium SL_7_1]
MGIVRLGAPSDIILKLRDSYNIRTFIETGTYQGWTAHWASQWFDQVITIELAKPLYDYAKSTYQAATNIEFLYGDTREQLRSIVPRLATPSLFWLDAHWSGGVTYGESDECPLAEELEIINRSPLDHFILIDDARLFLSPPPRPHQIDQWVDLSTLMALINASIHEKYTVVSEDVLIVVPKQARSLVAPYCQDLNTKFWEQFCNQTNARKLVENSFPQSGSASLTTGELEVLKGISLAGKVVFDVGAHTGAWSKAALNHWADVQIHTFEPTPKSYHALIQYLAEFLPTEQLIPNQLAVSDQPGLQTFYLYEDAPTWNTLHRRNALEKQGLRSPSPLSVLTTTLDQYCEQIGLRRINFLKIDVEGEEANVLLGAKELLRQERIDYVQFEYGGTWRDAEKNLGEVFIFLHDFNYALFKIQPNGLQFIPQFTPELEDFEFSNYLAVHQRFQEHPSTEASWDLAEWFTKYDIQPSYLIHIGAAEPETIDRYQQLDMEGVLWVEANSDAFDRLEQQIAGIDTMLAVQCNVGDRVQVGVQVTLDYLLEDLQLDPTQFNLLILETEATAYSILQGATASLSYLDAILAKVDYEEIKPGFALIDGVDEWLERYDFIRVETIESHAFYIKKPIVSLSTLGSNGRFANQLFQYMFLKTYAKVHNLRVEVPAWIGQVLFGTIDPPISAQYPTVGSPEDVLPELAKSLMDGAPTPYKNVDFWGYFQYHTRVYAPHKDYIRSLFQPVPSITIEMGQLFDRLRSQGHTIIGLHLRRKDYGYEYFFVAPNQWYKDWLKGLWDTLDDPVLFIASDDLESVLPDFSEYNPVTSNSLDANFQTAPFYPDFYLLSQCDLLAISNSSFSFAASLLNDRATHFVRPHLPSRKLIPYNPWNSEPLLRDARVEGGGFGQIQG